MKRFFYRFLICAVGFAVTGCVTCQECGTLKLNNDVARLFLDGQVVSGYSYYYSGPEQRPSAVMAIDSGFTVMAQFWKPVERDEQELSGWLLNAVNWKGVEQQNNRRGAEILSPEGEQIGIFYSKYDRLVTKFGEDNVIEVYPPAYQSGSSRGGDDEDRR